MIPVSQPSLGKLEQFYVRECFEANQITQGPQVKCFEGRLSEMLGVRYVAACSNGTTALHVALAALGIGAGDEVLVPDVTFVATANAVRYTGARAVLVDVDPHTWCMSPEATERKISHRTKAILPVHLYGIAADVPALQALAKDRGIRVIEDAAEGLGGHLNGRKLGTLGDAGIFSFYGNKVITTGEGGAVVTDDPDIDEAVRFLRGQAMDPTRRYFHPAIGFNYRMTDLQAAVGIGQLQRFDEIVRQRLEIFRRYLSKSCYNSCILPLAPSGSGQAPWLFTFLLPPDVDREVFMSWLHERGVETRPTFVPLHRLPMYEDDDRKFPESCRIGDRGVSLPTFTDLPLADVDRICDLVGEGLDHLQHRGCRT